MNLSYVGGMPVIIVITAVVNLCIDRSLGIVWSKYPGWKQLVCKLGYMTTGALIALAGRSI